jgi:hypothetical protein
VFHRIDRILWRVRHSQGVVIVGVGLSIQHLLS